MKKRRVLNPPFLNQEKDAILEIREEKQLDKNGRIKDFIAGIALILLSVFVLAESRIIFVKAEKEMHLSPALIPALLGTLLLILAIALFVGSLKDGGVRARCREMKEMLKEIKEDPNILRMLIGLCFMALYTFVLLGLLPFWLSTIIFLVALMKYLGAGSLPRIVIISVVVTGLIIILFQVLFRVPLP